MKELIAYLEGQLNLAKADEDVNALLIQGYEACLEDLKKYNDGKL